jgi:uncharacterized protein
MRHPDDAREQQTGFSDAAVATLRRRGYLTDLTPEQEQDHVVRLTALLQKQYQRYGVGFAIIPTYNCNLRCTYCYERLLRCNGRSWLETRMTQEVVDAAYEVMRELSASVGTLKGQTLILYGGEPLLASNLELIEYIITRGREEGCGFSAITNGVDLDHFLHLLGPDGIRHIQVTLDGPPEVHDRRRLRADGSGSFAAIAANISAALSAEVGIALRVNVDRTNVAQLKMLSRLIGEYGWSQHKNFSSYSYPVYGDSLSDWSAGMRIADLQVAYHCDLPAHPELRQIAEPAQVLQQRVETALFTSGFPAFRPSFCGSNMGMFLFDPFGDLYPCWDVVGRSEFKIGHFFPGSLQLDREAQRPWQERMVAQIPECRRCRYALLCGGGCTIQAYRASGRFDAPMCHDFPEQFELALPALYRQHAAQDGKDRGNFGSNRL